MALGVAVAASGCAEQSAGHIGAAACTEVVHSELRNVAVRVYDEAARGPNLVNSERRLERPRALAAAVAHGDAAATQAALRPLLRAQIQRVVITHGRGVLADAGSGAALAPAHGVIHDRTGAPVGRFTLSVGSDAGLAHLIRGLTGADVVMSVGGHSVATRHRHGHAGQRRRGTVRAGSRVGAGQRERPRGRPRHARDPGRPRLHQALTR